MEQTRVFVTGAGAIVGQGIIKCLRLSGLPVQLIAADVNPLGVGLFRADEAVLIPKVETPTALENIVEILKQKKIQIIMVGSEFDLMFFAEHRDYFERETGAVVITSPLETVRISDDKWLTTEFLKNYSFPYAPAALPQDIDDAVAIAQDWGYPLMIKPRSGTAARGVYMLKDEENLRRVFNTISNPMLQQCIAFPSAELKNEYTCSAFTCKDGSVLATFVARRILRGGSSWVFEVADIPELHALVRRIAEILPSRGSLNVQLMVGPKGPVPFEFNARFSGTIASRAYFGFNEPAMALQNYYKGEKLTVPSIRNGLALSFKEEVFIDVMQASDLIPPFPKGKIPVWF